MKIIKLNLQAIELCDIEEMVIADDGTILRVIPPIYNEEYRGLVLFTNTCQVGKKPILLRALGIYNLVIPCVIKEAINWFDESYEKFSSILFYPIDVTEDYDGKPNRKLAIKLSKDDFYPFYLKFEKLRLNRYVVDDNSSQVSFPIELYEADLAYIFKGKKQICKQITECIQHWKSQCPKACFMIEYIITNINNCQ